MYSYMTSGWMGFDDVRVSLPSRSYYYAGATRIAVRTGTGTGTTGLTFLFGYHLGSTSVSADSAGVKTSEIRYRAWGEDRHTSGSTPTDFAFTGQRSDSYINLLAFRLEWLNKQGTIEALKIQ